MRRLFLAAHGDDEVIGAGGTMCHCAARGDEVTVGVLTVDANPIDDQVRRAEAKAAWAELRVQNGDFAGLPGRPLVINLASVDAVCKWLRQWRPELIYVPHPAEIDPDHQAVSRIAQTALLRSTQRAMLLGYEVWTPLPAFHLVQDITAVRDEKRKAIAAYRSQVRRRAWADAALGLNRYRGVTTGRGQWCEVFVAVPG